MRVRTTPAAATAPDATVGDLLRIEDLTVHLPRHASRPVLDAVDLTVRPGEVVGLVGESGSGKSVTARAAIGLLPGGARTSGHVTVDGTPVLGADTATLRRLRCTTVSMVFQDPRAGINGLRRIGDFVTEGLRLGRGWSASRSEARALELLDAVGLPDPRRHLRQHPHELSGGMLQRVMIAAALSTEPRLLLCDEPTTALDVTTQAEILATLGRLQRELGMGMLFITHDLELAAATCDRVVVLYAGRIVEKAPATSLFAEPHHPYTAGLLGSTPRLEGDQQRLVPVPGTPLGLREDPPGCTFADRCAFVEPACRAETPALVPAGRPDRHDGAVRCRRSHEIRDELATLARGQGAPA